MSFDDFEFVGNHPTQIFLEKDGDIINIHFPGDVDLTPSGYDVVSELISRGIDILAFSNKFNNTNQKSEIMPNQGENKAEATPFESIANRLDNCRSRVLVVTNLLRLSVNNLTGSEPEPEGAQGKANDSPGESILSGLARLQKELEDQIGELEHEQGRLSSLLNIHL